MANSIKPMTLHAIEHQINLILSRINASDDKGRTCATQGECIVIRYESTGGEYALTMGQAEEYIDFLKWLELSMDTRYKRSIA